MTASSLPPRVYLDNAATSWPKPPEVCLAVEHALRLGAPAGRGVYAEARQIAQTVLAARRDVAELIGVADPRRVVFTKNCTEALNLALLGLLRPGDHVVASDAEHNSVLRPLRWLQAHRDVRVTLAPANGQGLVSPDDVKAALRPDTRLVALVHASNVTGALQPAAEIGALARAAGALFLLDAAQSLGHAPVSAAELNCDLLAAAGHKGLLGPLGTGFLYLAPGLEHQVTPLLFGGTGTNSEDDVQPLALPERYEAGNLNAPGLAGLAAGVAYVLARGVDALRRHELALTTRLLAGLAALDGVTTLGPPAAARVGVVSLTLRGYDPQEAAALLEAGYNVQARAGLHCAPRTHAALGTAPAGALRLSLGAFSTEADVDAALAAIAGIAEG